MANDGFRDYLFDYRHEGAEWAITIRAASPADAKERLKALAWAQYKGEVFATIPVPGPAARLFTPILRWFWP